MRTRRIVTAVITHGNCALVLRRSDRVGSYRGKWAGVSGSVDEGRTPEQQVVREIEEETGLPPGAVTLVRTGDPLEVRDRSLDTTWRVHPFRFEIAEPDRIRIDWEHTEFRWVRFEDLAAMDTVPRLAETFATVWSVEDRDPVEAIADAIRTDRVRGSAAIAADAVERLASVGARRAAAGEPAEALLVWMTGAAERLANVRPVFAGIGGSLFRFVEEVRTASTAGSAPPAAVRDALGRVEGLSRDAADAIAAACAQAVPAGSRVLTISRSGTVEKALRRLRPSVVAVGEGRPMLEGRALAEALAADGVPVRVCADGALHLGLAECDVVLIGADAVLPDGSVVNKAGTLPLCLANRELGRGARPVWVLAESVKRARDDSVTCECGPAEDIWPDAPPGVECRTMNFDRTPASLLTGWIDETGVRNESVAK